MQFTVILLGTTIALCLAYTILMNLVKKEVQTFLIRGLMAALLLMEGVVAFNLPSMIFSDSNMYKLAAVSLLASLFVVLAIVIFHRFYLQEKTYTQKLQVWVLKATSGVFSLLILQLIFLIASTIGY